MVKRHRHCRRQCQTQTLCMHDHLHILPAQNSNVTLLGVSLLREPAIICMAARCHLLGKCKQVILKCLFKCLLRIESVFLNFFLLTPHVHTICFFPSTNWTTETAAACYLPLVTDLTPCEQNRQEKQWKQGCRVVLFGQGSSPGLFSRQNRALTLSRRSGGRCLCVFVEKGKGTNEQGRVIQAINTQKKKKKHPQLCQPCPVCELNQLQLREQIHLSM